MNRTANRTAALLGLVLVASTGTNARAEGPVPTAYTLKAEGTLGDRRMTLTIVRDGARERVEHAIELPGRRVVQSSLYDFEAHRVYWIGWSGEGSCSSGRYRSARAPIGEDPVTGSADQLAELTKGRSRKPAGAGQVAGRSARIEALSGGKRPRDPLEPWPTRVWIGEDGGYLLKLEGAAAKGKAQTLVEVTQLTFEKPSDARLQPPAECIETNSDMDESGSIRSSGTVSIDATASASADLGSGRTSAQVTASEGQPGATSAARPLAKFRSVQVGILELPDEGRCGTKLQLTATLEVDGPATIWYRFTPSGGTVQFPGGQIGTVTVESAGSATVVKEATFPRSLKGGMKLQYQVQGSKGHDGQMKTTEPVAFEVVCKGK